MQRRAFIRNSGVFSLAALAGSALTLDVFSADKTKLKFGVAAITWGNDTDKAIKEISELGYRHIQLRRNFLPKPDDADRVAKIGELANKLKKAGLKPLVISGGNVDINKEQNQYELHSQALTDAETLGIEFYQLTNNSRPEKKDSYNIGVAVSQYTEELIKFGEQAKDHQVKLVYHNHMHQLGETPDEVRTIVNSLIKANMGLLLDVAHYQQGGGDPVKAILEFGKIISAIHLKDVKQDPTAKNGYTFVELGQGVVDIKGILQKLVEIKFDGPVIIELDAVPDPKRSPKDCLKISTDYLKSLGYTI